MQLKSLELTGFKSFAEAKIEFPAGVTAVVGPNGAGKSNVVDAVLWVLGEQSAKTLRSERMEDVIFNGTETRRPLGMVEVSLVLSGVAPEKLNAVPNGSATLGDYHEVMITRRLYRNGDSEYLLNKIPCRLKDIRSALLDSRAGTKGHTIIEQGRIEQILNASPQDRRELIEETAGIVRYKKQKAEAVRKLDSTQQNLLRVRDIIAEVRRQLNALERQAKQARSYQALHQEAKSLEIRLLIRECRALIEHRSTVETELQALATKEAGDLAEQAKLERQLEDLKVQLLSAADAIDRIRNELADVERRQGQAFTAVEVEKERLALYERQESQAREELARLSREREQDAAAISELKKRLADDEIDAANRAGRNAELESSLQALLSRQSTVGEEAERTRRDIVALTVQTTGGENTLISLAGQHEACRKRLDRLSAELSEMERDRAAAAERLQQIVADRETSERLMETLRSEAAAAHEQADQMEEELRQLDEAVARQQEQSTAIESRLHALQSVLREEMGYGRPGEEDTTSLRAACDGVRESMAEWLTVPPGLERAIEAVLGERVRAWLVGDPRQAWRAVDFLNRKNLGRGTFVPLEPRSSFETVEDRAATWWPLLNGQPGVLGRALDLLQVKAESRDVLIGLFERVVIVNSLEVAVQQWERHRWTAPDGPILVTIDGDVLEPSGILTGGDAGSAGGILLRRREVQRLEEERQSLVRSLEAAREKRVRLAEEHGLAEARVRHVSEAIRDADLRVMGLTKDESAFRQKVEELSGRIETVRMEHGADEQEQCRIQTEIETVRNRIFQCNQEKTVHEAALAELSGELKRIDEDRVGLQQQLTESRLALASLQARLEHGRSDLTRLTKEHDERESRARSLEEQLHGSAEAMRISRQERDRNETLIRELDRHVERIRADLLTAQNEHSRLMEAEQEMERALDAVRGAVSSGREARTGIEVRRAEITTQLAVRESTLTGTYQLSLDAALTTEAAAEPIQGGEGAASATSDDQAESLRAELQRIRERLERMGPINLAAIEEHRELEERYRFLTAQEEDLSQSVGSLKEIIARVNRTTKDLFHETFNELQQKFGEVFSRFFPGGRAELILTEGEDRPEDGVSEEPGVDIVAQPAGKRLKNIAMLSGGEKTLTAMALIFASFLIRPTPFCILDEIDAPLDEENIGRFTGVLKELAREAQFIVITHNKRTMAIADSLFGVTMEEPGISKLVSVRLADLQAA